LVVLWGLQPHALAADAPAALGLEAIAHGVRQGERRFENVAMAYCEVEDLVLPLEKRSRAIDYITHGEDEVLVVWQAGKLHFQERKVCQSVKFPAWEHKTFSSRFDGKLLRVLRVSADEGGNRTGGYANIISGQAPAVPWALSPLQLGCRMAGYKLSQSFDGTYTALTGGTDIEEVCVDGQERVGSLACVRLVIRTYRTNPADPDRDRRFLSRQVLWLALDHHFLPVRSYLFDTPDATVPGVTTDTDDWREIEPNVTVPFRAVKRTFWVEGGRATPESVNTVTVSSCSVRPAYPDAFFAELPFPSGIDVFVVDGEEIVRRYVQGVVPVPAPPADTADPVRTLCRWLFIAAGMLLLARAAAVVDRRVARWWQTSLA
jgi:hypothetical protein